MLESAIVVKSLIVIPLGNPFVFGIANRQQRIGILPKSTANDLETDPLSGTNFDLELIEINMPAQFGTWDLDQPPMGNG